MCHPKINHYLPSAQSDTVADQSDTVADQSDTVADQSDTDQGRSQNPGHPGAQAGHQWRSRASSHFTLPSESAAAQSNKGVSWIQCYSNNLPCVNF